MAAEHSNLLRDLNIIPEHIVLSGWTYNFIRHIVIFEEDKIGIPYLEFHCSINFAPYCAPHGYLPKDNVLLERMPWGILYCEYNLFFECLKNKRLSIPS